MHEKRGRKPKGCRPGLRCRLAGQKTVGASCSVGACEAVACAEGASRASRTSGGTADAGALSGPIRARCRRRTGAGTQGPAGGRIRRCGLEWGVNIRLESLNAGRKLGAIQSGPEGRGSGSLAAPDEKTLGVASFFVCSATLVGGPQRCSWHACLPAHSEVLHHLLASPWGPAATRVGRCVEFFEAKLRKIKHLEQHRGAAHYTGQSPATRSAGTSPCTCRAGARCALCPH
jgi:hypothetical protein